MRDKRAGALIIKDKKILLVTNDEADTYWTPGGRLEKDESYEEALHRELAEELGIELGQFKPFEVMTHGNDVAAKYFLVEIAGDPNPRSDEVTSFGWFSKDEILAQKENFTPHLTDHLLSELIKADLL